MLVTDGLGVRYVHSSSSSCTRKQQRKLFHDFTTYFVGELEENFVEMGDAEAKRARSLLLLLSDSCGIINWGSEAAEASEATVGKHI